MMTLELKDLGPYRIERSEDYDQCPFDKSYCELIRVKGSKPEPSFDVMSHVYKFSESELAIYLKDHKNLWRPLGDLLNEEVDISENEVILKFPVSKFKDIARIAPFVRKRGQVNLSESEKIERGNRLNKYLKPASKVEQREPDSAITDLGKAITLDTFEGGNL
ncbi:MAG: hypothetical protein ACYDAZ_01865 [Thermoplasmataceae archaeon]